ncbi:MAG: tagatose 1,6-diphosphate aldolase [Chloroflexota bacterium]|nr:tagatose 1,6-diphosphate aldolase [Chloroflexota bacterium]
MAYPLTPGRWRGLLSTSTPERVFTILAFDQRASYQKMLAPSASFADAAAIKTEVIAALSQHASAVLLDPDYGMGAAAGMARGGLLMSLEKSGYTGDSTYRGIDFDPDWTVAKIKHVGGNAIKLLAYYHPFSGALAEEIEGVIAGIIAQCHEHDIPVFLEPMSYSLDKAVSKDSAAFAATKPDVIRETAKRLGALKPDVLKLEYPIDPVYETDLSKGRAACDAISAACDVPWVLLSAGVNFDVFEPQVEIAVKAGASGYLAGRAIWKECVTMPSAERAAFIAGTAVERTERLNAIAATARPWTDFYTFPAYASGWYAG